MASERNVAEEFAKLVRDFDACVAEVIEVATSAGVSDGAMWGCIVKATTGSPPDILMTSSGAASPATVRNVLLGVQTAFEQRLRDIECITRARTSAEKVADAIWEFRHRRLDRFVAEEVAAYIKVVAPPAEYWQRIREGSKASSAQAAYRWTAHLKLPSVPMQNVWGAAPPRPPLRQLHLLRTAIFHWTRGRDLMFSLFKKKPKSPLAETEVEDRKTERESEPADRASNEMTELIARWDAMIVDSRGRFQAMLDEAAAGSEPLIAATVSDLTPLVLPWNTMGPRLREACDEVSEFWNQISDEMSECGGFSHEMMTREGNKRDVATGELELLHDRIYGRVMARAADRMRQIALGSDAIAHSCNQCGAVLDKVAPVSQSLNVECLYCTSVNTVHPGNALRMFAASGAMFLAAEESRDIGEAMRRTETRIKQVRDAKDVPLPWLIELETVTRTYWTTRLAAEARYNPDEANHVSAKLERHMKDVHKTLRRYWQWREYEHQQFAND